jgi:hypothetical protein
VGIPPLDVKPMLVKPIYLQQSIVNIQDPGQDPQRFADLFLAVR